MPLTTADEGNSSSSDSSASTNDSIDTLRPSDSLPSTLTTPSPWPKYFEQELFLDSTTATQHAKYHVYLTPPKDTLKGPLFICHHGAGATGMSFGVFAKEVKKQMPGAGVLSLEAREHGSAVFTSASDGKEILDFSIETLVADALAMIEGVKERLGWKTLPPSVLVGHSLGGAVVTRIAANGTLGAQLVGFAVLDVVEGSAIEALLHMKTYLASRPSSFASVDQAINWHIRSRTIRDLESAQASVPSLLIPEGDRWVWRTDLARTQRWWEEWFTGMSGLFLRGRAAKALVLAGTDRLDKELMVGQMQGKFQLTVIPEAGHFIQEDVPEKTAHLMIEFFKRNDRSSLVLPPKVSDLLAQGKRV
ncbi:protein phosphatase methylesterase [Aureobasidium sp. EXF-8845]|nr:protein phosphatase methylesterase [Aureobasidium sp. EXF-8845]KAI4817330.1 protein phosphatase methylesterase [Aureobasidium sp. EXF-8846]